MKCVFVVVAGGKKRKRFKICLGKRKRSKWKVQRRREALTL